MSSIITKGSDTNAVDTGASRTVERLRRSSPVGTTTTPAPKQSDSVSITDTARRLAILQELLANTPDIDAGRVAALSQAVEQGQYSADAHKIADRLLQLERDLAAAGRHKQS